MIDVLVVDDDFRVADIHREFVERCAGFRVAAVALTAKQAVEQNRLLRPDLVLLDLYLPDAHGLDIVRTLRSDSGADIVVITAARDVGNIKASMQQGALHYLVKPFQFSALRERLEAYQEFHRVLGTSTELPQARIDEALGVLRARSPELPKGLSRDTLYVVERTLEEAAKEITSEEVAHLSGVSRVTARRYLRFLVEAGRATATSEYGTPGRPRQRYAKRRPATEEQTK